MQMNDWADVGKLNYMIKKDIYIYLTIHQGQIIKGIGDFQKYRQCQSKCPNCRL